MQQIDFLAIGDIVTDAFIRIKDAEAHCEIDNSNCKLILRFGDKVPYESVTEVRAVGNSANAAVSAARLGLNASLVANVGNDYHGTACLDELKLNNIDTTYIGVHDGIPTNYHYVLWYDVERTILVKHADFPTSFPADMPAPKMIYLSSLGEQSLAYHQEIATYITAHPEVKLVFQPGTFQIKFGVDKLKNIYAQTYAFFCNLEEAKRILATEEKDIKMLMQKLHELGPKIVFITDGINGAYASDGTNIWFMPVYPQNPFERTGAGDAFASTVSAGLLLGKTIPKALLWGPINSASVVQEIGAQKGLLMREELEKRLTAAPETYQPKEI